MKTNPLHQFAYVIFALVLIASCGPCRVPLPQIYFQPDISYGGRTVSVARDPSNNNTFIVASDGGGLFRSKNAGVDWTQVSDSTTFGFNDVIFCAAKPSIVIAVANMDSKTTNGGGVWRSTDSGSSWTHVAITPPSGYSSNYLSAYCAANEKGIDRMWIGTNFGLAYSTNKGASWQFTKGSANYNPEAVYSVLAPEKNRIIILTYGGVKVSANGGKDWIFNNTAIPGLFGNGEAQSQLACSPLNDNDIFLACQYSDSVGNWHVAMYASYDTGHSWTNIIDEQKIQNRSPICRAARSIDGKASDFDVYFGDGQFILERGTFSNGTVPTLKGSWVNLNLPHPDLADLSFMKDGKTPALLVGDGGIMSTADSGLNWQMTGGGVHGYDALEISDVTGQRHQSDSNSDLYFATWDNYMWASSDGGETWPYQNFSEGYDLNISRSYIAPSATKLSGINFIYNFISGRLLANGGSFPDVTYCTGPPCLLVPGTYIESDSIPGFPQINAFSLSTDTGGSWNLKYSFINSTPALSTVVMDNGGPIIFTPAIDTGITPQGYPIIGIKKIVGVLAPGTPVVSDITGFGSLNNGLILGADVFNPNHLIVPDILSDSVKVTFDGGGSWKTDSNLTRLVTQSGKLYFEGGQYGDLEQITNIAFDPTESGHIIVGTYQAGIFSSCDNGETWNSIPGTTLIPDVTSFYFKTENIVVVSSWGRGLTQILLPTCPVVKKPQIRNNSQYQMEESLIYWKGAMIPISQIHNPDACPICGFYLVNEGDVSEITLSDEDNKVTSVSTSTGIIAGYSYDGRRIETTSFRVSKSDKNFDVGTDKTLSGILGKGFHIKGIYVEGNLFKGLLLSKRDITLSELPKVQEIKSYIKAELLREKGKDEIKAIRLRGKGFEKEEPFEISVDRKRIDLKKDKTVFDKNGDFVMYLTLPFVPGKHTLLIEQKTQNGVVKEATYFVIPSGDMK